MREHEIYRHRCYRQSVNTALVFSVIALDPAHESHHQHPRIRLISHGESLSSRSVIPIKCQTSARVFPLHSNALSPSFLLN